MMVDETCPCCLCLETKYNSFFMALQLITKYLQLKSLFPLRHIICVFYDAFSDQAFWNFAKCTHGTSIDLAVPGRAYSILSSIPLSKTCFVTFSTSCVISSSLSCLSQCIGIFTGINCVLGSGQSPCLHRTRYSH